MRGGGGGGGGGEVGERSRNGTVILEINAWLK